MYHASEECECDSKLQSTNQTHLSILGFRNSNGASQVRLIIDLPMIKVKACPVYDPYVGECLLERTLVLSHRLCEVGWPVPFLAAFISPVFPSGTHLLLGGQLVGNQPLALCWSQTVVFASGSKRSNRYATRPLLPMIVNSKTTNDSFYVRCCYIHTT